MADTEAFKKQGAKTMRRKTEIREQIELMQLAVDLTEKYGVDKLNKIIGIINENPIELQEAREQRTTNCCGGGKWMLCGSMFRASVV